MINYKKVNIHWNYFLAIENDFEKITRFIEPSEQNNNTFSIELARLILASTQEVDVILKKICKIIDPRKSASSINKYYSIITEALPEIPHEIVQIPRFGMTSMPWAKWTLNNESPEWWQANNKLKHHRSDNFEKANFINAFNSIGALLIVTLYYYKLEIEKMKGKEICWTDLTHELTPRTSLFRLKDDYYFEIGHWAEVQW